MRFGTFHLHSIPPWTNGYDVVEQQFEQILLADAIGSGLRNLPLEHDSDPPLTAL